MGMFLFILSLICFALIIPILVVRWTEDVMAPDRYGTRRPTGETRKASLPKGLAVAALVAGLLFFLLGSITIVQAKNVGVLTTFGKVSDRTLSPGIHLKLPWQRVTEIDGTWQPDEYKGDDCIYALIGDGTRACFSLTNRWRPVAENANRIYSEYRSDDPTATLRSSVVSTQLKAAVLEVASGFNPTAKLQVVKGEDAQAAANKNFDLEAGQLEDDLMASMKRRLGNDPLVHIQSITISYIALSEATQKRIDQFTEEVGRTRIAAQQVETNRQVALANKVLADSISNDPNVLVSRCLDLAEAGKKIGLSCWPLGDSANVLVRGN